MEKRRLALIILCSLLVGLMMIPLNLCFYNVSVVPYPSYTHNYYLTGIISRHNSPIFAKDMIFVRNYTNLNTEFSLTIELPGVPQIDSVNITLSDIVAPNHTIRTEEEPEKLESIKDKIYLMSFKLNQTCNLYRFSLFLADVGKTPIYIDFDIYNAKWNQSLSRIEPNQSIYTGPEKNDYNLTDQVGNAWKTIIFDPALHLNPTVTENQTFFMVLGQDHPESEEVSWGYNDDDKREDYGPAYFNNSGTFDLYEDDFSMRGYVSASSTGDPEVPWPTEINLKINGINVQNSTNEGLGIWNMTGDFGSSYILIFDFDSTWLSSVSFNATVEIYGTNLYGSILMSTLFQGYSMGLIFQNQERTNTFLLLGVIGAVAVAGASGYRVNKKRKIPINALKNMENILIDHKTAGVLMWSFDFISMQQDIVLVSGFMSAIKSFLEEMKVGGMKRLSTEFGTFIREESQLLTATCITGEMGLDEEIWIRGKLHEFLIKIEQSHLEQLEDWRGDLGKFKETFLVILGSLINFEKVQKLQIQKTERLAKRKEKLKKKINKYGAKLEELKSMYDSGEIDFKKYVFERYKTEAKYDKVQKEYIYASLFLQRVSPKLEAERVTPKVTKKIENIQNRFLKVRVEIEELERKEWEGVITSKDIERREKLQRELFALIEELSKFQEK
ncbi:MAG: hypothetical protein ACETWM_09145 [Candidatus Lokiarchaeia archaeon]